MSEINKDSWRDYVAYISFGDEKMPDLMSHYDLVLDDELEKLQRSGRDEWSIGDDLRCLANLLYLTTRKNQYGDWQPWRRMPSDIDRAYSRELELMDGSAAPAGVDKDAIRSAAYDYLQRPHLHTEAIDFLVMGALVEAEMSAAAFHLSNRALGFWGLLASRGTSVTRGMLFKAFFRGVWSFILIVIAIGVGSGLAQTDPVYALLPALVWLYVQKGRKDRAAVSLKPLETLQELVSTHRELLGSTQICWKRIGHQVKMSTDRGIVWDNELWLLVEQRGGF